jgi:PAS domain S-box-containing protein
MERSRSRTQEQLAAEIAELRRRIAELETAGAGRELVEKELRAELERKTLDALGHSERRFEDLVQAINAIVWEADARTFAFSFVSEQAEAILGYPVEDWLQQPSFWADHLHPDDREAAVSYCLECTRTLRNHEFEYRMIAKDGKAVWVRDLVTVEASTDGAPARLRGVMFDVTRRKHLESQLMQAQKMESVGRLAGGIAHDFNNMLTAILGHTELCSRALLVGGGRAREHLHEIQEAALRARDLTRQLLTFARREVAEPRVLDVDSLVQDAGKLLRRIIGEDIELVLPTAKSATLIRADAVQIERVLVNLAVNARDAMPRGGTLRIAVTPVTLGLDEAKQHGALPAGSYVRLTVSDTGVGMSEEAKAHLFEPFFTTKAVGKGTGLGLATCYAIVAQSGGHIEVESELGRGTTVIIHLPRVRGVADAADTRVGSEPELPRGRETVLVVEDEPVVRALSTRILREQGYTVLEAQNGEEALRLASTYEGGPIQLLLTDVVMPQMRGDALAQRFRLEHPATRVLFTSGYADSESFRANLIATGTGFIEKPFSPASLARKVRETLDSKPSPSSSR